MKLKQEIMHKSKIKYKYITIYSIQSKIEQVNIEMIKLSNRITSHIKYVSFKQNTKNERVAALHLKKLLDCKLKYEWLDNVNITEITQYEG